MMTAKRLRTVTVTLTEAEALALLSTRERLTTDSDYPDEPVVAHRAERKIERALTSLYLAAEAISA